MEKYSILPGMVTFEQLQESIIEELREMHNGKFIKNGAFAKPLWRGWDIKQLYCARDRHICIVAEYEYDHKGLEFNIFPSNGGYMVGGRELLEAAANINENTIDSWQMVRNIMDIGKKLGLIKENPVKLIGYAPLPHGC